MPIRLLSEQVIRRIRAGEVVERPAAAVKELVENAIDAGARNIRIEVLGGGVERILVVDDGCGMDAADLRLSVERHATSKLDGDDPLLARTMGFRGEALAALSAVAKVQIVSRQASSIGAWRLLSSPDGVSEVEPCGGPRGTSIEVLDLFFSHPARAGFLKGRRSETVAIRAVVEAAALSCPGIGFYLAAEGRSLLMLAAASWDARAAAVMGPQFIDNSLRFAATAPGMRLQGRIGLPGWQGHAAAGQRLLVNGRPVRDQVLGSALRAAFANLSREASPAAVLALDLDAGLVDANVHPAKAQVRWRDADAVHALVRSTIREALEGGAPRQHAGLGAAVAAAAVPVAPDGEVDRRRLPLGRALAVVMGGFGLSETTGGLIVLDLHALDERRMFTKLSAAARGGGVASRALAHPVMLRLGAAAAASIEERLPSLEALGLQLSVMDDATLAVYAIPSLLPDAVAPALVRDVANVLAQDAHGDPLGSLLDALCAKMACHSAFRFGDDCSLDALDQLLRDCEAGPNSGLCPHGRPTAVEISRERVESLFGRH